MLSSLPPRPKQSRYIGFGDDTALEKGEEEGQYVEPPRRRWCNLNAVPWILTVLLAGWSLYQYHTQSGICPQPKICQCRQEKASPLGSFEEGFSTELAAVKPRIMVEQHKFWGTPTWTDDGNATLLLEPGQPVFVGEASDEIDRNWERFIGHRYFRISEDEARASFGPKYKQYWDVEEGGYVVGLDAMHLLHCLNHIRKEFNPERQTKEDHGKIDPVFHRNHCIEAIRQSLMCHADLAPIPSRWFKYLNQNYVDTNRPHVCRNWNRIRDWVTERYEVSWDD